MASTSKTLMKALDRVTDLKADLKEANAELKEVDAICYFYRSQFP